MRSTTRRRSASVMPGGRRGGQGFGGRGTRASARPGGEAEVRGGGGGGGGGVGGGGGGAQARVGGEPGGRGGRDPPEARPHPGRELYPRHSAAVSGARRVFQRHRGPQPPGVPREAG